MAAGKTCKACNKWKPLAAYWLERRTLDGRRATCTDCVVAARSRKIIPIAEIRARKLRERRLPLLREVLAKLQTKQSDQTQGAATR